MAVENPQKAHYEAVHDVYERHYYDATSMAYRREFFYGPLFKGVDLNGLSVAEIGCGSGHNSMALKEMFPRVAVHGFDISEAACDEYRRRVGPCSLVDFTRPLEVEQRFDAVLMIGALHHCVNDLPVTLRNLGLILRPGGTVFMMEPSARCFLEFARRLWYRLDGSFEAGTEAALDPRELERMAAPGFTAEMTRYAGGPAFFLIFNSMIFRLPLAAKPYLAPPLTLAERAWNAIPLAPLHAFFLARWKRTDAPIRPQG